MDEDSETKYQGVILKRQVCVCVCREETCVCV